MSVLEQALTSPLTLNLSALGSLARTQSLTLAHDIYAALLHAPLSFLGVGVALYFAGTVFFDAVHYLFHLASKSRYRVLRWLGQVHLVHHLYFNRRLKFNPRYHWHNLLIEIPLELACQLIGSWLGWLAIQRLQPWGYDPPREQLALLLIIEVARVVVVMAEGGHDSNHITYDVVPDDKNWMLIGPEYHSLHHTYPDRYMASALRVFDQVLGLSSYLRAKRVAITGGSGAYGTALKKQLLAEGVASITDLKYGRDWTHDDFSAALPILRDTDVLILAHGSKGPDAVQANTHSSIRLIELFRAHRVARPYFGMTVPEIWYAGSEIELHPAWGIADLQRYSRSKRAFLPTAKALYRDPSVLYRHVVLASFRSPMGPALVSADWAAWWTMWWVRRGARYVPVTYTGMAYVNFFKFWLWTRPGVLKEVVQVRVDGAGDGDGKSGKVVEGGR